MPCFAQILLKVSNLITIISGRWHWWPHLGSCWHGYHSVSYAWPKWFSLRLKFLRVSTNNWLQNAGQFYAFKCTFRLSSSSFAVLQVRHRIQPVYLLLFGWRLQERLRQFHVAIFGEVSWDHVEKFWSGVGQLNASQSSYVPAAPKIRLSTQAH